jgi:hypothetical protein
MATSGVAQGGRSESASAPPEAARILPPAWGLALPLPLLTLLVDLLLGDLDELLGQACKAEAFQVLRLGSARRRWFALSHGAGLLGEREEGSRGPAGATARVTPTVSEPVAVLRVVPVPTSYADKYPHTLHVSQQAGQVAGGRPQRPRAACGGPVGCWL